MADAICSILASLFTSMPNTTFSQNNGVIAMTKCASRRAGIATGFWLIIMGIFSKSESLLILTFFDFVFISLITPLFSLRISCWNYYEYSGLCDRRNDYLSFLQRLD